MAQTSKIEWTDATPSLRVRATAAARIGVPLSEYDASLAAGLKWCTGCRDWHLRADFARDRSRGDGLTARCRAYANRKAQTDYVPKARPEPGRRYVDARDGDEKQARRRVNHLVDIGALPRPNDLLCTDCGHVWGAGQRRHEYDHHRGYAPEHHEDVEPVCTACHHTRTNSRGSAA